MMSRNMEQQETNTINLKNQKAKFALLIKAWAIALFGVLLLLNLLLFREQMPKMVPFVIQSGYSLFMWLLTTIFEYRELHLVESHLNESFVSFIKVFFSLDVCLLYLLQLFLSVLLLLL